MRYFKLQKLEFKQLIDDMTIIKLKKEYILRRSKLPQKGVHIYLSLMPLKQV